LMKHSQLRRYPMLIGQRLFGYVSWLPCPTGKHRREPAMKSLSITFPGSGI
jgi:hypothetical protein